MAAEIAIQNLLVSDFAAFVSGILGTLAVGNAARRGAGRASGAHDLRAAAAWLDQNPDAVLRLDPDLGCVFASQAAARIFGHPPATLVGRDFRSLVTQEGAPLEAALERARAGHPGAEAVLRADRPNGDPLWLEARFGIVAADGCLLVAIRDISTRRTAELALRVANVELNKLAGSDALTGLANRRRFDQALETEIRRAARGAKPLSLLLLDVDRFKAYNDRYGHQAGDACLKQIGAAIRSAAVRGTDVAARFGGEEFALILPATDDAAAAEAAERIRHAVADLALPHEGDPDALGIVTVSIGCATACPPPGSLRVEGSGLVAEADRALYDAKRLGRNRVASAERMRGDANAPRPLIADAARLRRLGSLRDAGAFSPSANLHRIARMAAVLLGVPMAFVALLDQDDAVVVGHHGMGEDPVSVAHAACAQLLGARGTIVLTDVGADRRFQDLRLRYDAAFLAAAPLLSGPDLHHVGGLWIADRKARPGLDEAKRGLLSRLAALVVEDLEARTPPALPAVA